MIIRITYENTENMPILAIIIWIINWAKMPKKAPLCIEGTCLKSWLVNDFTGLVAFIAHVLLFFLYMMD